MGSEALGAFVQAVQEVDTLQGTDPTPRGRAPVDPAAARVVGRASVVLLSSHFERYLYAVNAEATRAVNSGGAVGEALPETLRLLHSSVSVDEMLKTDWEHRGEKLIAFMRSDAWLWDTNSPGDLDHERLLIWMKAPTPRNLVRYYRYWEIPDIFDAITRTAHTRTDLWLGLDALVRKRNNIAHGDPTTEATHRDVRTYRDASLRFCERADKQLSRAVAQILRASRPW